MSDKSHTYTKSEQAAYDLGVEHAKNAASWVIDGNTTQEHAARLLKMLDDGDPAADDYLPRRPDLSGEYADDLTPPALWEQITGRGWARPEDVDALAGAYEEGVSDTFEPECERILRAAL